VTKLVQANAPVVQIQGFTLRAARPSIDGTIRSSVIEELKNGNSKLKTPSVSLISSNVVNAIVSKAQPAQSPSGVFSNLEKPSQKDGKRNKPGSLVLKLQLMMMDNQLH